MKKDKEVTMFVTRWEGKVQEMTGIVTGDNERYFKPHGTYWTMLTINTDCFYVREDAEAHLQKKRIKRAKSLRTQLEKLEAEIARHTK